MMHPLSRLLIASALLLNLGSYASPADACSGCISIDRMGAGAPAGWLVTSENIAWECERGTGPFGPGAGRFSFTEEDSIEIASPACVIEPGKPYAATVWMRAEPAPASVRLAICDNISESTLLQTGEQNVASEWTPLLIHQALPAATRNQYFLRLAVRGENTTVWMDALWLGPCADAPAPDWRPPVHPVSVTLTPDAAWGLVTGSMPQQVHARVAGVTQEGCHLRLHVIPTDGEPEVLPEIPVDVTGLWGKTLTIEGTAIARFGMQRVGAIVTDSAGAPLSAAAETLLARAPDPIPGPRPDSPFGVHVSLREPDVNVAAKLGYKWCRIHDASGITKWGHAEPEPGQWRWFDNDVAIARRAGLSILGMLDGSPAWESGTDEGGYWSIYGAPRNVDHWRNYVRQVVGHYADSIDEWEVWNEPWDMMRFFHGGTPMLYAELLRAAYEEAKTVHPACTIIGVDTYPPFWEQMVLAAGAYPYFDMLSWHRYDPNLHAWPNDSLSRVANRINTEQAKYGTPKPTLCSEGGPDVTMFHGSYFSFADPDITGDWSEGADRYARMFLGTIAAGHKRFIAYSIHNVARHGWQTHMMLEPGPLLRPMHLAVAALAHFVEGAQYVERLQPGPDISAHVFEQVEDRNYASPPSTIVVLHSDGSDSEALVKPIPDGVRCFDRWGNPAAMPVAAARGLAYLVADGALRVPLLAALRPETEPAHLTYGEQDIDTTMKRLESSLASGSPPLWTLLSAQGSLVVIEHDHQAFVSNRRELRTQRDCAAVFHLGSNLSVDSCETKDAGIFRIGQARLRDSKDVQWRATFCATPDAPDGSLRFLTLTLQPYHDQDDAGNENHVLDLAKRWESALLVSSTNALWGLYHDGPCCLAAATKNGEYFVFDKPEYLLTMMNTAVVWGKAARSIMNFSSVSMGEKTATIVGEWDIASFAFGAAKFPFAATLIRKDGEWRFAGFAMGPPYVVRGKKEARAGL